MLQSNVLYNVNYLRTLWQMRYYHTGAQAPQEGGVFMRSQFTGKSRAIITMLSEE
jgi:hypothetical protein